jgi:hypothetical protein
VGKRSSTHAEIRRTASEKQDNPRGDAFIMFDPIQQQAGQTLLRGIANQASLGALPYPEEPVPDADREPVMGWVRLQARRLTALFDRVPPRRSRAGQPARIAR